MPNVNGGILHAGQPRNHADAPSDGTTVVHTPSAGRKRWKPCRSCRSSITNGSRVCQRHATMRRWRRSCGQSAPSIWRSSMLSCPEALVGTEDPSSWVVFSSGETPFVKPTRLCLNGGKTCEYAVIVTFRTRPYGLCSSNLFLFISVLCFFEPSQIIHTDMQYLRNFGNGDSLNPRTFVRFNLGP